MFRRTLTTYLTSAVILTFAAAPVLAQDKGARPNPGGNAGGGSGRTASGGGGGGGSESGGGSSSSGNSGANSGSRPPAFTPGFNTEFAPARPERRAEPRNSGQRPNSGNRDSARTSGDRDTARTGNEQQRRVAPGANASVSSGDESGGRRAVPTYARPRDGRPVTGTATERRPVTFARPGYGYDPYYRYSNFYNRYPYGYYYAGYGLGLGYFYDPFLWGYYSPYAYGGSPYYYGGGYGYAGGYGGGYGGGYSREHREVGGLRLKVKPLNGQVYVDGYYVGEVDSFDGTFQRLQIEAGAHKVEIRADGFETVQFDVMVTPGETVTYKGEMKRIQ